jgi:uracil-DNA glycosylase
MSADSLRLRDEWKKLLAEEFSKDYWKSLTERVKAEYQKEKVFPHPKHIFRAFEACAPQEVKVVILGQDPYHTPGVAHGLSFSTESTNPVPPSLQNIFKEIALEFDTPVSKDPDLSRWAKQGVLLLNASLTVRSGMANSHQDYGWHTFTDAVIRAISSETEHVAFMLWGSFAGKKAEFIDEKKHLVLRSAHPSPLSAHRGFLGNGHFKRANEYLEAHGREAIDWS